MQAHFGLWRFVHKMYFSVFLIALFVCCHGHSPEPHASEGAEPRTYKGLHYLGTWLPSAASENDSGAGPERRSGSSGGPSDYYCSVEKDTWPGAVELCKSMTDNRGNLIKIETAEEDKMVHDFIRKDKVHKISEFIWTDGVSDRMRRWFWNSNGQPLVYTNFEVEPGAGGYLAFRSLTERSSDTDYKWRALYDGQERHYYLCEVEQASSPSVPGPGLSTTPAPAPRASTCTEHKHPSECQAEPGCSFCFDTCTGKVKHRCDTQDNLKAAGCAKLKFDMADYGKVVNTNVPGCSPAYVPVIPGHKRNVSVTFKLEKHPLDLYYLMDFSSSMRDDQKKLEPLSAALLIALKELSTDFTIGFGTFVDKPNGEHNGGRPGDYSFRNDLALTTNTADFVKRVKAAKILDGGDMPESHADALAQVGECTKEIGWRKNARHVVLVATDAKFHYGGEGHSHGKNVPYSPGCYLNSAGHYTKQLEFDYPSLDQLGAATAKQKITTIFASGSDTQAFYRDMVGPKVKPSVFGVLALDSSNIIELVKNEFRAIDSRMEIEKSKTADPVHFRFFSKCSNGKEEKETRICENLPSGGEVTFIIEVDPAQCPADPNNAAVVVKFSPVGLPVSREVTYGYVCDFKS